MDVLTDHQPARWQHIDPASLLAELNGDLVAFRALSATYLRIAPQMLANVEQAHGAALAVAAHALRGATALMGATALTAQLAELERRAAPRCALAGTPEMAELARRCAAVAEDVADSIVHFHPD